MVTLQVWQAVGLALMLLAIGATAGLVVGGLMAAAKRGDEVCALGPECPKRVP